MENEKVEKVLGGCLDNLPDMELTSILLFFSSTFTDMSVERNYLVQNAVPKIRMYCLQRGLDFQIIDMRWGVRDEASVDHSTTDIVLQQVELCQKLSKGPNFVAFLGDRYGSRLLQKHIEEAEFKLLRRTALKLKQDVNLLDRWYLKNENVIPTEYLLRPITDIYPDYNNNDPDKEKLQKQAKSDWNSTNEKLLSILRTAADQAYTENLITKECRQQYFQSVTEAEVEKGILEYSLYKEKVLCYNRVFEDINIEDKIAARFVDMRDGKLDDEAAELRVRLQVARVFPLLGPDQKRKDHLYWTPEGVDVNDEQHSQYLENLCSDFEKKIIKMIDDCTTNPRSNSGSIKHIMFKEILHHLHFTRNKIKEFCGRTELLEEIKEQMMVYHGEEIEFSKKTDESESKDEDQNGQLNDHINQIHEDEERYWEEQKSLKKHLNSLGVIYCHGDRDLDIESDPNRNLKAELIKIPEIKHYSRPIVLYGESGSGKTAIMAKIACEAQHWFPGSVLVVRFFGTSPSASFIRTSLVGVCNQIHFMYKVQVPAGLDLESDFDYLQKYFISLLWRINTESKPLVIILDSVDQLSPNDYAYLLYWLPLKLPPNVHMIVSMLPNVENCLINMKQLMPFAKQYIEVPALPLDTADHIISLMLKHKNCRLTKLQKRYLLECFASCSYPLYLKLLVDESITWKSYTVITDLDPGKDITGAINKIFDRLEKNHGSIVVAKFCGYLGVSKEGLTETELEDILSLDDEVLQDTYIFHLPPDPEHIRLPTSIRTQLIVNLKEYLVKQMSGGWTVINWYHRQFKQAAKERYILKNVKQKLHEVLAEYFMGSWYKKVKPLELYKRKKGSYPNNTRLVPPQPLCFGEMAGKRGYNSRKLVELPYHLTKAKLFDLFCSEVACNFEFLLVKCKIFNVNILIQDMREAIAEMDGDGNIDQQEVYSDIQTVYNSLMFGCNQIRRDPNTLATFLIAKIGPDCSNSPSIQKLLDDAKQWYMNTEIPLLVPVFKCLPSPGDILQGTIHVDVFLRGEERNFKDTLAFNMDKNYLYVIQPESRSIVDHLKVYDLTAEATCIMTKRLKSKIKKIKYLAKNGYLQFTTEEEVDQIYDIPPENPVRFTQEPKYLTVSESGKYLAFSTGVPDIHICQVNNSLNDVKIVHTIKDHEDVIFLNITPDDKMLVGDFPKYRVIWSVETGKELFKLDGGVPDRKHTQLNTHITRGNIMLCGGCPSEYTQEVLGVHAIDLETGTQLYEVNHDDSHYGLAFLSVHNSEKYFATGPSGSIIINGKKTKYWTIRDVITGEEVSKCTKEALYNPSYGVENLKMFGKDHLLVAVSLHGKRGVDCPITLAFAGTVSNPLSDIYPFRRLNGHSDSILSILISPDDSMMFTAGKDNLIHIWNLEKIVREFEEEFSDVKEDIKKLEECGQALCTNIVTSTCMKICRNSKTCYVGTSDGNLIVYDLEEVKKKLTRQIFEKSEVKFILVSSTNKYVIAASALGEICIWNIEKCTVDHKLKFNHKLSCLDEGNNILIAGSGGMEGNGCIWNIETGEEIQRLSLTYSFYEVAMHPSGKEFVSSLFDFPIICPVSPDDAKQAQINMNQLDTASFQGPTHLSFSRDGSLASSGSMDGALRVITAKGEYIFRMQQKSTITCAAFSVNGQYVVTGGYRSVYVWSISDGSLKFKLRNHTDFITNIKFDETGQFMITTSIDKKIVLWDFKRGFSLASFLSYCPLDTIDFSLNGQYIVYSPGNVGMLAVLKPNPVLKKILEGSYSSIVSNSLQGAQALALSFSSQKVQDTKNSQACEIM